jgi:hypothetical protein
MKIKSLGKNITQVETRDYIILVSYETPVAAYDKGECKHYKTDEFYSVTTSRHINQWLDNANVSEKDQEFFNRLLD